MNALNFKLSTRMVTAIAVIVAVPASAQVPVDESGAPLANYESFEPDAAAGNEDIPLLTQTELQELVGPIALYPDDLLAIVLPDMGGYSVCSMITKPASASGSVGGRIRLQQVAG